MGLREWAVKPGQLKPLGRPGLLFFAARCALRVEPWRVIGTESLWDEGLALLVACAAADRVGREAEVVPLARAVAAPGAHACNALAERNEALGRCHNYAHETLGEALRATAVSEPKALVKAVIAIAKCAASIPAVWAHAGHVPEGLDAACTATWAAIVGDLAPLATFRGDSVAALRAVAPLWPEGVPAWATPPR